MYDSHRLLARVFSHFEYEYDDGVVEVEYIEPLVGILRHPALCLAGNNPRGGTPEKSLRALLKFSRSYVIFAQ